MNVQSFVDESIKRGKTREEAIKFLQDNGYVNKPDTSNSLSSITPGNIIVGAGKGALSTLRGATSLSEKVLSQTGGRISNILAGKGNIPTKTYTESTIPKPQANNLGEKIGFGSEQVGEFFIPGTSALKLGKAASTVVKGGKLLKGAVGLGATGLAEGVLGTGQSALQSGKIGGEELATGAISTVVPAGLAGASKVLNVGKQLLRPSTEKVVDYIFKAIKPSLGVNATKQSIDTYTRKAVDAFNVISKNKHTLQFEDNNGNLISRLPENRAELLDSIGKVKSNLYQSWSKLQQGVYGFNPSNILGKLDDVSVSKKYAPEVRAYAEKLKFDIKELAGETADVVDARIADLNSSLGSFYSGRGDKAKAQVDASVADALREELDNIVISAKGEGVKGLRNAYSSLKTIEKDVVRQVKNEMKKADKSLLDFTDVFTGSDLVSGILTLNPAQIGKGVVGRTWKEFYKYLNDPNRSVKKIFELIEKK